MAGREQPYDPYIPSGSNGQQGGQYDGGNARTAAIQSVRDNASFSLMIEVSSGARFVCLLESFPTVQ